jgi:2-amino-4-hydroxy-6-hydroxymethyldihydropteridine diphosphokinase
METAYLGIGTNLGDRAATLCRAVAALGNRPDLHLRAASRVYETAPIGIPDQPTFFNAALQIETDLSPRALLEVLLGLEGEFGRVRKQKWGPRTLDLDVLMYGRAVIREEGLEIPHPYMHERGFVLVPLCDLNPEGCHPVLKQTFRTLALAVGATRAVRPVEGLSLLSVCP